MGIEHLKNKRTGRPRGSKSAPPWRRDLLWAYRHLGEEDVVPPSPRAAIWLTLAREHPERFLDCLVRLEDRAKANRRTQGTKALPRIPAVRNNTRLRTVQRL